MTTKDAIGAKILTLEGLTTLLQIWKLRQFKTVFTNGCFDLLHFGHLTYLMEAKTLGQKLIIGLNSDSSVKRLKGASRPIKDQHSRSWLLASMVYVDAVVIFEEDTPENLIRSITPDVLVKGGDYSPDQIVGAQWVRAHGGDVKILPFIEGYSTTALEQKIVSAARP